MDDAEALRALEEALARRDEAAIPGGYEAVLHDSLVEFGSSGRVWTRDEVLEDLAAGPRTGAVDIEKFDVHVVRPGVFLVMYETVETGRRDRTDGATASELAVDARGRRVPAPVPPEHADPAQLGRRLRREEREEQRQLAVDRFW